MPLHTTVDRGDRADPGAFLWKENFIDRSILWDLNSEDEGQIFIRLLQADIDSVAKDSPTRKWTTTSRGVIHYKVLGMKGPERRTLPTTSTPGRRSNANKLLNLYEAEHPREKYDMYLWNRRWPTRHATYCPGLHAVVCAWCKPSIILCTFRLECLLPRGEREYKSLTRTTSIRCSRSEGWQQSQSHCLVTASDYFTNSLPRHTSQVCMPWADIPGPPKFEALHQSSLRKRDENQTHINGLREPSRLSYYLYKQRDVAPICGALLYQMGGALRIFRRRISGWKPNPD